MFLLKSESLPILYKKDTSGSIRVWQVELIDNRYRVISGLLDGKKTTSDWQYAEVKNLGRSNETTPEQQAKLEVDALYTKQKNQGRYFENISDIDGETYFKPMLAIKFKDVKSWNFKKESYYSQPKLDGLRCVARSDGLFSRNGKEIVSSPHIQKELEYLFNKYPNLIVDGELYNHIFKDDFNTIQSLVNQKKPTKEDLRNSQQYVEYHIYDFYDGSDLSFSERFNKYSQEINLDGMLRLVSTTQVTSLEHIDEVYASYLSDKYEGQMIRVNREYESKRSKFLIKRKEFFDEEYKLLYLEEGSGNWAGKIKTAVCQLANGVEFRASVKGSMEQLESLLFDKTRYENDRAEVTVRYPNLTPDGKPRFGVVVALWENGRNL